ncbi:MAG TPA: hypothetical protein VN224_01995 [Xanthomonadales bacterium]|nr:hypothetical protein [Xanthomonadales bacterium]
MAKIISDKGSGSVAYVATANLTQYKVSIVDVVATLRGTYKLPIFSLRRLLDIVQPIALIGGAPSVPGGVPKPYGLLRVRGRTINNLDDEHPDDGVLCIADTKVSIVTSKQLSSCGDAIQGGLIVVQRSYASNLINEQEQWNFHSAVCANDHEISFVATYKYNFASLASLMSRRTPQGLGCDAGLLLSDGPSAAMSVHAARGFSAVGYPDALFSSALELTAR